MPSKTKDRPKKRITKASTREGRSLVKQLRRWSGQYMSDMREAQLTVRAAASALEQALDLCDHLREGLEAIATVDCVPWGNDSVDFGVCEGQDEMSKVARKTLGWPDRPRCKHCDMPVHKGNKCADPEGCR